jgi:FeS assembly SUF system protein|tara:strand:+ start:571 stop:897 length:327 start_codon:yes stop_codon:yes gene_type:complete
MNESPFPPESVESQIVDVIKTCYDPEIPVNIFELGLIYEIAFNEGVAKVMMTLTSPMCPVAESLPPEVQQKILDGVTDVTDASVEVTWDPPWDMDMMSEAAKLQLGMM